MILAVVVMLVCEEDQVLFGEIGIVGESESGFEMLWMCLGS